jgi:hypothetical protein
MGWANRQVDAHTRGLHEDAGRECNEGPPCHFIVSPDSRINGEAVTGYPPNPRSAVF